MAKQERGSLYQQIYALVQQVPPGRVTTYGRLGQRLGCSARSVGFAMAALPPGSDVPWQRVINAQGKVSPRRDDAGNLLQRDLLQSEGVKFAVDGSIDLATYLHDFSSAG